MTYGAWPRSWNDRGTGSWDLPMDATLRVHPGRNGVVVRADAGLLHVTQSGDREDHVLARGEELRLPRAGWSWPSRSSARGLWCETRVVIRG